MVVCPFVALVINFIVHSLLELAGLLGPNAVILYEQHFQRLFSEQQSLRVL